MYVNYYSPSPTSNPGTRVYHRAQLVGLSPYIFLEVSNNRNVSESNHLFTQWLDDFRYLGLEKEFQKAWVSQASYSTKNQPQVWMII